MTEERWTADDAQCEVIRENMRAHERNSNMRNAIDELINVINKQYPDGWPKDVEILIDMLLLERSKR